MKIGFSSQPSAAGLEGQAGPWQCGLDSVFDTLPLHIQMNNIDEGLPSKEPATTKNPMAEEMKGLASAPIDLFGFWHHRGKISCMLFMVIEHFKDGNPRLVGERFKKNGRMLPEGVFYHASWVDSAGTRCFQVMETEHRELLDAWVRRWDDLIEFDIVPVLTSNDFWAQATI